MKLLRFKNFLQEARRSTHDVKQYLSHRSKPYEFWLSTRYDYPFPISGPMLKRLSISEKVTAFHILPTQHLDKLLSIVNSSKAISAFTWIGDRRTATDILYTGVDAGGGIVVELYGDGIFEGQYDIFTSSDNQGRRWMDLRSFESTMKTATNRDLARSFDTLLKEYKKAFTNDIFDAAEDLLSNENLEMMKIFEYELPMSYQLDVTGRDLKEAKRFVLKFREDFVNAYAPTGKEWSPDHIKFMQKLQKNGSKVLSEVTRKLFDTAENVIEDHLYTFKKVINYESGSAYNEIVMSNFEAVTIYVLGTHWSENDTFLMKSWADKAGVPIDFLDDDQQDWLINQLLRKSR